MKKEQLEMLEQALESEINAALGHKPDLFQTTRQSLADEMVNDGLLERRATVWYGVMLRGYGLTTAGHMAYCSECAHNE